MSTTAQLTPGLNVARVKPARGNNSGSRLITNATARTLPWRLWPCISSIISRVHRGTCQNAVGDIGYFIHLGLLGVRGPSRCERYE